MTKVISIVNQKGGVGKTNVCANLGICFPTTKELRAELNNVVINAYNIALEKMQGISEKESKKTPEITAEVKEPEKDFDSIEIKDAEKAADISETKESEKDSVVIENSEQTKTDDISETKDTEKTPDVSEIKEPEKTDVAETKESEKDSENLESKKSEKSCTCHYIRVEVVQKLILETINRVRNYALDNETDFIERVREQSALQQETAVKESRKKLTKSKRRRDEVSGLIKKLYESYASEKIPEKHFSDLLANYDEEYTNLDAEIGELQTAIDNYNTDSVRADKFIELVKRHTEFKEFSAMLLNEFVEKVIVHEAVKIGGKRTMQVDIHLNFIGNINLPESEIQEEEPVRKSKKKLRRDMTAEQVARERERGYLC